MKRLPIYGEDRSDVAASANADETAKSYWRSLKELQDSAAWDEVVAREIPDGRDELPEGMSRRSFMSVMGASMALAGVAGAGCRRPEEKILPYAQAPEDFIPGRPEYYATAVPFAGTAFGLLVESHEHRPTKIEGNPRHPESKGATNSYLQAMVLDLYDPDRSQSPSQKGATKDWSDAGTFLRELGGQLKEKGGKGLAILTDEHRSPTTVAALAAVKKLMPETKVYRYEPFSRTASREGAQIAFGGGTALDAVYDLSQADVIVSLDADFLSGEGSSLKHARAFSAGRKVEKPGDKMNRLYVVESAFSLTGTAADHRLRLASRDIARFAAALSKKLAAAGVPIVDGFANLAGDAPAGTDAWVAALAKDLAANRGKVVVIAGDKQPAAVHALAHVLNIALDGVGKTVTFVPAFDAETPEGPAALAALTKAIGDKSVDTLLILGGNPAFNAPADLGFAQALAQVGTSVHLSTHVDETSAAATWHLNRAHALESWSDVRSEDGTAAIVQPLIAPLFEGKTDAEVLMLLVGERTKAHELVRATWQAGTLHVDFDKAWRRALHDGVWPQTASTPVAPTAQAANVAKAFAELKTGDGIEVTFHPDFHAHDGRFANNGWLQELPEPMTKLTWGNAALVSPTTAKKLGVEDNSVLSIGVGGATVKLPVVIQPGQADDSIAVSVGQGRRAGGNVGKDVGVDTYGLRVSAALGFAVAQVSKVGAEVKLPRTQEHFTMAGRPLVREASLAKFSEEPDFAKKAVKLIEGASLYEVAQGTGHKWGMVIDLTSCTGCGGCVTACQSENNIPVVGVEGVQKSREMHWLRIDRYYSGSEDDPQSVAQPMPCQHCENAPCEEVCPVGATTHSPEGINDMAYNRCVGTKYCANNCPFKVRHFNYLNYTKSTPELHKLQMNPNVTVRSRGVMEKCTFCVQRVNEAKIGAKREGRDRLHDGEVVSACQQSCPTQAISFGDLNDPNSEVAKKAAEARSYRLLEEINVKPRVHYLAKIRNPNPELERA